MTDPIIGIYCERGATGLWAEPVNLLTNLAFIVAAGLAYTDFARARLSPRRHWDLALLILILAAIGIGSALWHSFAAPWSGWADVVPIGLFIAVFLASYLWRVAQTGLILGLWPWLAFHALQAGAMIWLPPTWLNGSIAYVPALLGLALITLHARLRQPELNSYFGLALGLLLVSLTARSIDNLICPWLPIGTHFLWHLCNAALLYLLLGGLIRHSDVAYHPASS